MVEAMVQKGDPAAFGYYKIRYSKLKDARGSNPQIESAIAFILRLSSANKYALE